MGTNTWIMLVLFVVLVIYYLYKHYFDKTRSLESDWVKDIVKALLATLLPILYTTITNKYPGFPLSGGMFTDLFTWLVFLVFWGTGIYQFAKAGFTQVQLRASKYK